MKDLGAGREIQERREVMEVSSLTTHKSPGGLVSKHSFDYVRLGVEAQESAFLQTLR